MTIAGPSPRQIAAAVVARHQEVSSRLRILDVDRLQESSRLPGWSRLTIVCHLRYGALAYLRMTNDILAARPTAYYPLGRERQRPTTLIPQTGEEPTDVVASFASSATELDDAWRQLGESDWSRRLIEPDENRDLGPLSLDALVLLRLTEVEVHGSDLDIDSDPWSDTFVDAALLMRLQWLTSKRTHHRHGDATTHGSWVLAAVDGDQFSIVANEHGIRVTQGDGVERCDARIEGTKRQLIAYILGRRSLDDLTVVGKVDVAARFLTVFPPP